MGNSKGRAGSVLCSPYCEMAMRLGNHSSLPGLSVAFTPHMGTLSLGRYRKSAVIPIRQVEVSSPVTGLRIFRSHGWGPLTFGSVAVTHRKTLPLRAQAAKVNRPKRAKRSGANRLVLQRTGMNYPLVLSKELQEFLGAEMMTRAEILAKLCQYIKEHNLQVPQRKQYFVCDETFKRLFGVTGEFRLLKLQALLKPHLTPASELGKEYEHKAHELFQKYLDERGAVCSTEVVKRNDPRGLNSIKAQKDLHARGLGMYAETEVSPCLRTICDGKERMSRPDILKAVWKYIKSNGLQDANQKHIVHINDVLGEALQITHLKSVDSFGLPKYIWRQTGRHAQRASQ